MKKLLKNKKQLAILGAVIATILVLGLAFKFLYHGNSSENLFLEEKGESRASAKSSKKVLAKFNGGKVTLREAQNELNKLIAQNPGLDGLVFENLTFEQKEALIKEVALKEMSYKEAKRINLHRNKDFKEAVRMFESQLLQQALYIKLSQEAVKEDNLKKNYDEVAATLKDKKDYRVRFISLKTKEKSDSLHKHLSKYPKSFEYQAKIKSLDKETAKKGGDLGFILETALPLPFAQQARTLEKGEISKPFFMAEKWFIIKLEDTRDAKLLTFEETKNNLAQSLSAKAVQDFIESSLKKAQIDILVD